MPAGTHDILPTQVEGIQFCNVIENNGHDTPTDRSSIYIIDKNQTNYQD